jgi:3',5'-nucleoside bisphosphate phosphatase
LQTLRAELHVHTVLSPCADVEMIPPLIIQKAIDDGIDILAITDHNSTANIPSIQQVARGTGVYVLPGMELQTVEEIHVICLFDLLEQAYALQAVVDKALPLLQNNVDFFGEQFIVDDTGDFLKREERLLLTSTSLTLNEAWRIVTNLDGLLIPAHVNRKAYGLIPTLGFIPTDIPIKILEISSQVSPAQAIQAFPQLLEYDLIQSGDAHFLEDILGLNQLTLDSVSISEISKALTNQEGRSHYISPHSS